MTVSEKYNKFGEDLLHYNIVVLKCLCRRDVC